MRRRLAVVTVALGFAIGLGWSGVASAATTGYPPVGPAIATNTSIASPGGPLVVIGTDYVPFELVTLVLHSSTPVTLGTTTADSTGSFSDPVTIPAGTALGAHTIVGTGATGDSAATAITVVAAVTPVAVITPTSTSGLPFTGADIATMSGVGAIALALGGLLILTGRRRRTAG